MTFVPPGSLVGPLQSSVAPIPQAPSGLSDGDSPGSQPLTIGSVQFNSIECPADLPIGAVQQRLAVIELIGGGRVVQALGIQPKPVTWTGKLWGASVQARVAQMRAYAVGGQEQPITWSDESWFGIVRQFTPTYHHRWLASYSITLEITRDGNGALTNTAIPSTDTQVSNLTNNASNLVPQLTPSSSVISQDWSNYLAALGGITAISLLTPNELLPIVGTLTAMLSDLAAYGAANGLNVDAGTLLPGYLPWTQLTTTASLILANIRNGQAPKAMTVRGGSLFEIAAMQFGDVTQAFSIAQQNNLPTPRLSNTAVLTLNIPLQKAAL